VESIHFDKLKEILPTGVADKSWGDISLCLYNLMSILQDVNSTSVQRAQRNIIAACGAVEAELLDWFDASITLVMKNPQRKSYIDDSKELAEWLHLFNSGQSVQKRYIFYVVRNYAIALHLLCSRFA
jgi:hypothetical protein